MTNPPNLNNVIFYSLIFLPMIIIGAMGVYYGHIAIIFGGAALGIFLAKMSLIFGVCK
jgi:hypothetical protein